MAQTVAVAAGMSNTHTHTVSDIHTPIHSHTRSWAKKGIRNCVNTFLCTRFAFDKQQQQQRQQLFKLCAM